MYSTFPQLLLTESPERVAANLKDGKIALMMDGSSVIFVLPATFSMFFQTPDDYTARWVLGFFYRTIRYFGYVIALYLPAVYVAVASFHYELIPTELVYSFQQSLSYVPFRPVIELIGMQASLELLREASLRLPTPVAATFGIVGAIVVGTAMVEAGFISYGGLVVVAITAVSSFVQPNNEMSNSIRVLGFPLMIFASIFGFLGLVLGTLVAVIHLSRLETFGKPYFTPFAPLKFKEFKDTLIRTPVSMGKKKEKQKGKKAKKGWKLDEGENPY
jgi:spore germination protein KA